MICHPPNWRVGAQEPHGTPIHTPGHPLTNYRSQRWPSVSGLGLYLQKRTTHCTHHNKPTVSPHPTSTGRYPGTGSTHLSSEVVELDGLERAIDDGGGLELGGRVLNAGNHFWRCSKVGWGGGRGEGRAGWKQRGARRCRPSWARPAGPAIGAIRRVPPRTPPARRPLAARPPAPVDLSALPTV